MSGVPPAGAKVTGEPVKAWPQFVLGRAGEERDPGPGVRIEVGLRRRQ